MGVHYRVFPSKNRGLVNEKVVRRGKGILKVSILIIHEVVQYIGGCSIQPWDALAHFTHGDLLPRLKILPQKYRYISARTLKNINKDYKFLTNVARIVKNYLHL